MSPPRGDVPAVAELAPPFIATLPDAPLAQACARFAGDAALLLLGALFGARWAYQFFRVDPAAQLAEVGHPTDKRDASARLEAIRAAHKLPALAAVVLRGHDVILQGAAGVREAGQPSAITLRDRFHLGSNTKAMTATLIAQLVDEGMLRWDSRIGEIFAREIPDLHPDWAPVTLLQLLQHRGGAPADLEADGLWARLRASEETPREQRRQLAHAVLTRPPAQPPGGEFVYSNAGYALAGAMAEIVTGRPWEDLLQQRLFGPLQITSGGFGAPGEPETLTEPRGHSTLGRAVAPGPRADNPPAISPAGTVHLSLPDWARFVSLHLRGHRMNPHRETRLLTAESFDRLHRRPDAPGRSYAAGWLVGRREWAKGPRESDVGTALTHAGSNTLWYCAVWIAPEKDLAVLVACNQGGPEAAQACDEAVGALLHEPSL